jgi:hypothetical protein
MTGARPAQYRAIKGIFVQNAVMVETIAGQEKSSSSRLTVQAAPVRFSAASSIRRRIHSSAFKIS